MNTPRLAPEFRAVVVDPETVVLLSEARPIILRGAPYAQLVPLLDGSRHVDAVVAAAPALDPVTSWYALARLDAMGCLTDGGEPPAARSLLDDALPPVAGDDLLWKFEATRSRSGAPWLAGSASPTRGQRTLTIVITDDYLAPGIAATCDDARKNGRAWLLLRPVGQSVWIGPLFSPAEEGPCWHCLAHHLRRNQPLEAYLRAQGIGDVLPPLPPLPVTQSHAVSALRDVVAAWRRSPHAPPLRGVLRTIGEAGVAAEHVVRQRPQCAACGSADRYTRTASHPPHLDVGASRPESLPALRRRLEREVSPLTGVATSLHRVEHGCGPSIVLHVAEQSRCRQPPTLEYLLLDATQRAAGKGRSDDESVVSALAEAAERRSGSFHGDEPRRRATRRSLGDDALPPNRVTLFSDRQLQSSPGPTAVSRRPAPPLPFDDDVELDWTPIWSLTHARWRYLPTSALYYDVPTPSHERVAVADSNGCAAGATLADAVVRALLELIERDAVGIWWYNRLQRPAISLDRRASPFMAAMDELYVAHGREFWCLDLTTDIGIPACAAVSRQRGDGGERILMGFGAGLEMSDAAERAMMEMNQLLAATDAHAGETPPDPEFAHWLTHARGDAHPYLLPRGSTVPATPSRQPDDADPLETLHRAIRCAGLELLVLDQSRPDISVAVARVVVPGLRHFWPRSAPGRLYDVPVERGWLPAPLDESALNPVAIFL